MRRHESASPAELRRFGLSIAVAFLFVAAVHWGLLWHRSGVMPSFPVVLPAFALMSAVLSLFSPTTLRPLHIVSEKVMNAVAWVITYVLLTVAFIVLFLPAGLVLRIAARDPLKRAPDSSVSSYWEKAEIQSDSFESYLRQF